MGFRGVATALVGPKENPRIIANTYHLKAWSARNPTCSNIRFAQERLIRDCDFEHLHNINKDLNDKDFAKEFLQIINDVAQMQQEDDENARSPLAFVLGFDNRNGSHYYPVWDLVKEFYRANKIELDKLIDLTQMFYGAFTEFGKKANLKKRFLTSEQIEFLNSRKNKLNDPEALAALCLFAIELADDSKVLMAFMNSNPRFVGMPSNKQDFEFLSWHPEIERAFIDRIRVNYMLAYPKEARIRMSPAKMYHIHFKYDDKREEPFSHVVQTMLLDQLAESEDGKNRICPRDSQKLKSRFRKWSKG
jgi:hypothetical protein